MIIITKKGAYKWNYKRGLRNIGKVLLTILVIGSILLVSNMEYQELITR